MIKNLQKLTMNSMVTYSHFPFFVKIIQIKDMENDTINFCFFKSEKNKTDTH